MEHRPDGQRKNHHAETELERVEIAAPLCEPPGLPREENVDKPVQRGEGEIVFAAEAKLMLHEEVEVIKVECRREGTQAFECEVGEFKPATFFSNHMTPRHACRRNRHRRREKQTTKA